MYNSLIPFLPFGELVLDLVVHDIFTKTFSEMALVVHLLFSDKFGQS